MASYIITVEVDTGEDDDGDDFVEDRFRHLIALGQQQAFDISDDDGADPEDIARAERAYGLTIGEIEVREDG